MTYIGSWDIDDVLTFTCNTHTPSTGAGTDADDVPAYRVYENETGTAILSGTMAKLDDASTVGHYSEAITISAANGFERGKCYNVYISAVVGGVTGTTERNFQVGAKVDVRYVAGSAASTSSMTEQTIADAVWDEDQSGHTDAGSFGKYLDSWCCG
jgi:hypothetical protein